MTEEHVEGVKEFWKGVWETEGTGDPNHLALKEWADKTRAECTSERETQPITKEQAWARTVKKMAGWRAPGPDMIEGFWWKSLPGLASLLRKYLCEAMDGDRGIPDWMVRGRTVMIPKITKITKITCPLLSQISHQLCHLGHSLTLLLG